MTSEESNQKQMTWHSKTQSGIQTYIIKVFAKTLEQFHALEQFHVKVEVKDWPRYVDISRFQKDFRRAAVNVDNRGQFVTSLKLAETTGIAMRVKMQPSSTAKPKSKCAGTIRLTIDKDPVVMPPDVSELATSELSEAFMNELLLYFKKEMAEI
eukprot:Platyproteum_vivax@DN5797_c0_g1_i1.p1